jgi:hypothetical protein
MKILLLTPPMIQLNTPYPATQYLTGYLRQHEFDVIQADPAIELVLHLFSENGLQAIKEELEKNDSPSLAVQFFLEEFETYRHVVGPTIKFLQGKDSSLALRIASRMFLPEGPSFDALQEWEQLEDDDLHWAFGSMGAQDKAKYFASLFIDDLAKVIRDGVDGRFSLSRYGERLAISADSFDPLHNALQESPTLVGRILKDLVRGYVAKFQPDVVGLTVPFPGNLFGALQIGQLIKNEFPHIKITLGGGYPNTELRELSEIRIFDYIDYMTIDDGEKPLHRLLNHLDGKIEREKLFRTFTLKSSVEKNGKERRDVEYISNLNEVDVSHGMIGTPTYDGLDLGHYLQVCEMLNPMHRIWSDGRWNKLTLAHGCYWSQCSFCDVNLDYINRYQETDIDTLISRIKKIIAETGQTGFHFVDEAAPPKILFALARRIIDEGIVMSWWGNVRFEKSFSPKMAKLLADSGCIAVTGGLEVASNRLLKLMKKGVTVEQVARVTHSLSQAGILVHAYLMYGFPSQNEQETVDALEMVRQLFTQGCIQSAFWHRFAATVHSPVGQNPEKFSIALIPRAENRFAKNDLDFVDPVECDHDLLGRGLRKALYNYMLGIGFDEPLSFWFDKEVCSTTVAEDFIEQPAL